MRQHQGLPLWAWLAGALLLAGLIALVIWAIVDSGEVEAGVTSSADVHLVSS